MVKRLLGCLDSELATIWGSRSGVKGSDPFSVTSLQRSHLGRRALCRRVLCRRVAASFSRGAVLLRFYTGVAGLNACTRGTEAWSRRVELKETDGVCEFPMDPSDTVGRATFALMHPGWK